MLRRKFGRLQLGISFILLAVEAPGGGGASVCMESGARVGIIGCNLKLIRFLEGMYV